jgi:uncharacterized membrane protein YbhN (UPF0104 family)
MRGLTRRSADKSRLTAYLLARRLHGDCNGKRVVEDAPMPAGSARLGRALRWLARAGVTAAIVAWILADVEVGALRDALLGVRPGPFAAAVALYLAGQLLSAWKWALLGRVLGFVCPLGVYVRYYLIGMFFNVFGPSTVGGDVARALYLGAGRSRVLALDTVLLDRASGLAFLAGVAAVAVLAFPAWRLPWPLTAGVVTGGTLLVLGWGLCPLVVRLLPATSRLRRHLEHDLAPLWRAPGVLAATAALSVVFHLSQVLVQWVLARALGVPVPFSYCLVFHPLVSIVTALPVSLGGFGVREGGYLYFLTRIGVDASLAVTMGLLWFVVTLVGGLVGGVAFLAAGARLPRLRAEPVSALDLR